MAWDGDPRVSPRTQSSVAVSVDGRSWLLLNASPDLRQQIAAAGVLHPRGSSRTSPLSGVFLTNGDVDHIAGLLTLRERQALTLYGSRASLAVLAQSPVFRVLDPELVKQVPVDLGTAVSALPGLSVMPFAVPGKVPLFLEGETVQVGAETETTLGLDITAGGRRLLYIPGCADLTPGLLARMTGADLLLFDGTTFTDDEMVRLGLSPKTARRMGHLAVGGPDGSLQRLARTQIGRKVYVHINNTNPILVAGSPEQKAVEAAGWEVGFDGMEIAL